MEIVQDGFRLPVVGVTRVLVRHSHEFDVQVGSPSGPWHTIQNPSGNWRGPSVVSAAPGSSLVLEVMTPMLALSVVEGGRTTPLVHPAFDERGTAVHIEGDTAVCRCWTGGDSTGRPRLVHRQVLVSGIGPGRRLVVPGRPWPSMGRPYTDGSSG